MSEELPCPSKVPCGTCPYRTDVPSGIWDAHEYLKLPQYDGETMDQIIKGAHALFYCHQNDGHLCAGWVGCHDTNHLAALRFNRVDPETFNYVSPIELFPSGAEAAIHGMEEIENPPPEARVAIAKLEAKRNI